MPPRILGKVLASRILAEGISVKYKQTVGNAGVETGPWARGGPGRPTGMRGVTAHLRVPWAVGDEPAPQPGGPLPSHHWKRPVACQEARFFVGRRP